MSRKKLGTEAILIYIVSGIFITLIIGISAENYTAKYRAKKQSEEQETYAQMLKDAENTMEEYNEAQKEIAKEEFANVQLVYRNAIAKYEEIVGELPPDVFTPNDYDRLVRPPIPQNYIETGPIVTIIKR